MEYVSPIDARVEEPVPLAPRTVSVHGARVVLLDITKARGAEFLDRIELRLQAEGAETFRVAKEIFSRPASAEVIENVAIHGDLAVEGLAD
jgi:hypothetical protein